MYHYQHIKTRFKGIQPVHKLIKSNVPFSKLKKKKSSSVRFERLSNIESTVRSVDADPILHRVPAAVL